MTVLLLRSLSSVVLVALLAPLQAGEVQSVRVEKSGSYYNFDLHMLIDSEPEAVRNIVTDYARLERISPVIVESRLLEKQIDGSQRRKLVTHSCLWFFCVDATMVEDVAEPSPGVIMATIIPDQSDYRYGQSQWRIQPRPGGTQIRFTATLAPDYWIPPIIGPWLMEQKMRDEAEKMILAIEQLSGND